ncbi:MAG: hypothetical protein DVB31_05085 [Verrucomicrobia bacterium]|nr:MAG: hypothetical protein DVB31_05085 [Verrucomicrobiota bacterium]
MTPFPANARSLLLAALLAAGAPGFARADGTNAPAGPSPATTNAPATATNTPAGPTGTNAVAGKVPEAARGGTGGAATNAPAAMPADDSAANGSRKIEFADFRLVGDRNIFNPNRSARAARNGRGVERKPVRIETFSLVGVMNYDRGDLAFFDSAAAAYRKNVRTNETIAGYRVAAVTPSEVKLEANGKTVVARVGTRFRRADEGPWELTAPGGVPAAEPKPEPASADGTTDAEPAADAAAEKETAGGGTSGEVSDVLKRLRQKREQENKNEKQ